MQQRSRAQKDNSRFNNVMSTDDVFIQVKQNQIDGVRLQQELQVYMAYLLFLFHGNLMFVSMWC